MVTDDSALPHPLPLTTDRLLLRPLRPKDAPFLRLMWTERDERVPPHRKIDADGRPTVADLARWVEQDRAGTSAGLLAVTDIDTDRIYGYCGLITSDNVPEGEVEIAYEFAEEFWGRGFATEAAEAVVGWARSLGHRRLWSTVLEWNAASFAVLEKLGFVRSGQVDVSEAYGDSVYLLLDFDAAAASADETDAATTSADVADGTDSADETDDAATSAKGPDDAGVEAGADTDSGTASTMGVSYAWRGEFGNDEVNALHSAAFGTRPLDDDWRERLERLSLGWVVARDPGEGGRLIGFVNVIWDGCAHAFVLDTAVDPGRRRRGIGTRLISVARDHVEKAGCEWLHVDFEPELRGYYFGTCGFVPTDAGLIPLNR